MSDIPTEIYVEILRRVPVESLFRFRSVCKLWLHIIDDPSFSKQHISRGIGENWFFCRHGKGKLFLLPINELIYSDKRNSRIRWTNATNVKTMVGLGVPRMHKFHVPSCNGLILLSSCKSMVWRIWNPFTGESLELGKCDELAKCVNFDNLCSGIGYDEANDDYKVVRIVDGLDTYIYSVNSKEWHRIGNFPDSIIGHENGVFAYGVLHWIVYSKEQDGEARWIVALDLSTRNYRKIALPSEIAQQTQFCLRLNELSGCLFLSCTSLIGHSVVWMIKDYGCKDTWIKMISLKTISAITPLAYLKTKEQVLLYHYWRYKECYYWYDVGKKCVERLGIDVITNGFEDELDFHEYIYATFSSQVFPASLIRLKRSDVSDERVSSQGTSKEKRKRAMDIERLLLKISFGDPEDWPSD